jgi:ABC-type molybdenum transport system ATPase subunit/photorepair protein PhrA
LAEFKFRISQALLIKGGLSFLFLSLSLFFLPLYSFSMSTQHSNYDLAVDVDKLNFDYGGPLILNNLSLALAPGSRCILVGANGAGKTTCLRILGGKRMVSGSRVNVLGKNVFQDAPKVSRSVTIHVTDSFMIGRYISWY